MPVPDLVTGELTLTGPITTASNATSGLGVDGRGANRRGTRR